MRLTPLLIPVWVFIGCSVVSVPFAGAAAGDTHQDLILKKRALLGEAASILTGGALDLRTAGRAAEKLARIGGQIEEVHLRARALPAPAADAVSDPMEKLEFAAGFLEGVIGGVEDRPEAIRALGPAIRRLQEKSGGRGKGAATMPWGTAAAAPAAGNTVETGIAEVSANERFKELLENSPFLRPLDLARSLIVTGLADVEGEILATIFDKDDESTTLVTDISGNERGMKIVGIRKDRRSKQVALKVSVRGAEIEIPFDVDALLPRPDPNKRGGDGRGDRGDGRGDRGGDGRGGQPPKHIMDKYNSMDRDQKGAYWKWAREYYQKNPELRNSDKRYPTVEKAIEAIKAGRQPPAN